MYVIWSINFSLYLWELCLLCNKNTVKVFYLIFWTKIYLDQWYKYYVFIPIFVWFLAYELWPWNKKVLDLIFFKTKSVKGWLWNHKTNCWFCLDFSALKLFIVSWLWRGYICLCVRLKPLWNMLFHFVNCVMTLCRCKQVCSLKNVFMNAVFVLSFH